MKPSKVILGILVGIGSHVPASWGQCPFSVDAGTAVLISYLNEHQSAEQNPCIDKSFEKLNRLLPTADLTDEQVQVLIRYLDHRRLPTAEEQHGFLIHISPLYPATTSILLIGRRASNLLLPALSGSGAQRFRENASFAWSLIYREDPVAGVRALALAAASQSDPQQANNLRDAATSVAHNCPAHVKAKCNSELSR